MSEAWKPRPCGCRVYETFSRAPEAAPAGPTAEEVAEAFAKWNDELAWMESHEHDRSHDEDSWKAEEAAWKLVREWAESRKTK